MLVSAGLTRSDGVSVVGRTLPIRAPPLCPVLVRRQGSAGAKLVRSNSGSESREFPAVCVFGAKKQSRVTPRCREPAQTRSPIHRQGQVEAVSYERGRVQVDESPGLT